MKTLQKLEIVKLGNKNQQQIIKMLNEISLKHSFTTLPSDSKLPCCCDCFDKQKLRTKLQQILMALYEDIAAKDRDTQLMKKQYEESIQQKQQIIDRLAEANSKLTLRNQVLVLELKKIKKSIEVKENEFIKIQTNYKLKIRQIESIKCYLEQKNEQLRNKIMIMRKLIPSQEYQIKRCASPTYLTRPYTQIDYFISERRSSFGGERFKQNQINFNILRYRSDSSSESKTQYSKKSSTLFGTSSTNLKQRKQFTPKTVRQVF